MTVGGGGGSTSVIVGAQLAGAAGNGALERVCSPGGPIIGAVAGGNTRRP
jgi:hypothetical protein